MNDIEKIDEKLSDKVAARFREIVRTELAEHLDEIDERNKTYEDCCATHDFCDANMLMFKACEEVLGWTDAPYEEWQFELWSNAWNKAKERPFKEEAA